MTEDGAAALGDDPRHPTAAATNDNCGGSQLLAGRAPLRDGGAQSTARDCASVAGADKLHTTLVLMTVPMVARANAVVR